ncbi:Translation initiation factor 2 [Minicystis rosea]|nr:Translation initiation factor 2 [Minicystis rosea]
MPSVHPPAPPVPVAPPPPGPELTVAPPVPVAPPLLGPELAVAPPVPIALPPEPDVAPVKPGSTPPHAAARQGTSAVKARHVQSVVSCKPLASDYGEGCVSRRLRARFRQADASRADAHDMQMGRGAERRLAFTPELFIAASRKPLRRRLAE